MGNANTINGNDLDLVVYDFDGVMTDNRANVMQDGTEGVLVNRSDGLGVNKIKSMGIPQLIMSTEANPVVKIRAKKLQLEVIHNCEDKCSALKQYCEKNGFELSKTVFVGNDVNDLEVMKAVGFPVAPADAYYYILEVAKIITIAKGGRGVVRELSDLIKF